MERKVIFIGGTSFSGSTFFDMSLANGPDGFSCGELYALFYPFEAHHFNPTCGCGDPGCEVWPTVKRKGLRNLYTTIFALFPQVKFIVDSSKDFLWIHDRSRELASDGIRVDHLLIWKTPEEFYRSCVKRNRSHNWESVWTNYHRAYFRMVPRWSSVKYRELTRSTDTLRAVCERLGIDYFVGKERFWEKKHHTLFGNSSAKIHLYEHGSPEYERIRVGRAARVAEEGKGYGAGKHHREIWYEGSPAKPEALPQHQMMTAIVRALEDTRIRGDAGDDERARSCEAVSHLKASMLYELYRRAKRQSLSRLTSLYATFGQPR